MSIAIFFGSTTGNTEAAAHQIKEALGELVTFIGDIADTKPADLSRFDVLIFGIPTWDVGELQYDWEDFIPDMHALDLTGKNIALFGLGDSFGYSNNFLDAMGLLWDELKVLGAPKLVGIWPTKGYTFDRSKGLFDPEHFLGLGLDEENESDLHDARIRGWTDKVKAELGLSAE